MQKRKREKNGEREEDRQRKIRQGEIAKRNPACARRKARNRNACRFRAEFAFQKPEGDAEKCETQQRDRKARGEIGTEAARRPSGNHPIQQRRFLKPGRAPKPWRDQVAAMRHGAADRSVARLIGPEDTNAIQLIKVQSRDRQRQSKKREIPPEGGQFPV